MSWLSEAGRSINKKVGVNPFNLIESSLIDRLTGASSAREANEMSLASTREQMVFQAEQARIQREYETGMSNTAHQREVQDLKAAGINPVLSAHSGGASTPSVSAPSGSTYTAQAEMPGGYLAQIEKVVSLVNMVASATKDTASARALNAQADSLQAQQPRKETIGNLWEIVLPWSHSAKKALRKKRNLNDDIESFWRSIGLGFDKPGPRMKKYFNEKGIKYNNHFEGR